MCMYTVCSIYRMCNVVSKMKMEHILWWYDDDYLYKTVYSQFCLIFKIKTLQGAFNKAKLTWTNHLQGHAFLFTYVLKKCSDESCGVLSSEKTSSAVSVRWVTTCLVWAITLTAVNTSSSKQKTQGSLNWPRIQWIQWSVHKLHSC